MNVISQQALREFWRRRPESEEPLRSCYRTCRKARWRNLDDVQDIYPHADVYGSCTVFNIGGNKYRLVVMINYAGQAIYIKNVLTHAEYDRERWKNDC
ncbi:MAG: type II toxin-antitoxin system HigB family toxin [Chloracidobacterium sp.]|nr:type II toxin-antitoxin system HigB family toxin [Chloracidobacterium sp.]